MAKVDPSRAFIEARVAYDVASDQALFLLTHGKFALRVEQFQNSETVGDNVKAFLLDIFRKEP